MSRVAATPVGDFSRPSSPSSSEKWCIVMYQVTRMVNWKKCRKQLTFHRWEVPIFADPHNYDWHWEVGGTDDGSLGFIHVRDFTVCDDEKDVVQSPSQILVPSGSQVWPLAQFCWVWLKESLSYGLSWVKAAPHLPKNIFSVQAVAKRGAVMVSKLKIVLVPFFKHHTQLVVILAP